MFIRHLVKKCKSIYTCLPLNILKNYDKTRATMCHGTTNGCFKFSVSLFFLNRQLEFQYHEVQNKYGYEWRTHLNNNTADSRKVRNSTNSNLITNYITSNSVLHQYNSLQLKGFNSLRSACCYSTNSRDGTQAKETKTTGKSPNLSGKQFEVIWTVPNALTMSRIILSPLLGYLVLQESFGLACGLFFFTGLTDVVDGWIARKYPSQMSAFGSFIDPLADKILISILFVTLTIVKLIPLPLALLVIGRDIGLIAAAFYVRYISLTPPISLRQFFDATNVTAQLKPMILSKLNTALQLGLVTVTLAAPVFGYIDHELLHYLWYTTAFTTTASGIGYMFAKDTFKLLNKKSNRREQ